ncbi:phosphoethanolamine transferase [Dyella sp. M7H15-1]|uniref:phosphoethanolamine transferase n=1 Tax=Dyella sp. M7H15-1 TaxID=2501295 RepID=UPI001004F896|nr:phosphoethanolamine transferase [Dyella sp. M7H15-1]QAU25134.1 phosphoethanolamine transferase [Dyella sp. M7H15-1]
MIDNKMLAKVTLAVLISLLMLPNIIWLIEGVRGRQWDSALIIPTLLLLLLFAVFGTRLWFACLALSPFAMLAPIECFYIAAYRRPSSAEILGSIFATNPGETLGYFGKLLLPLALCMLGGLLLALLAARMCYRSKLRWSNRTREWIFASGIILPLMIFIVGGINGKGNLRDHFTDGARTLTSLRSPIEDGYPFGPALRIWNFWIAWKAMYATYAQLSTFRFHATERTPVNQRQIYVLVIGESSRRNHWQLFGYERPTNPGLTKVRNLIRITDMVTSWPETMMAVPLILTRKPITYKSFTWHEASILRAMEEAGYDTWWISNQLAIGKYDSPVSTYALEAKHLIFINHATWTESNNFDGNLAPSLQEALTKTSEKNLFIVLHMMGSHQPYDLRYPPAYQKFTPILYEAHGSASQELRFRNSYDNTILYTDHVLTQVIDILNKSRAVSALWYESDHGETLPTPTCSMSGHDIGTRYDYMVPALFWYSDAYAAQFPERVAKLRENASQRTLSASTFESLADMAGIDFPGHNESWSLFNSQWSYHPRIVNGFWPTDLDKAQFGKGCEVVIPANP